MYRTPVRRAPRVAALWAAGPESAVIVIDPWEVRAAAVSTNPAFIRNLLLRERPTLIVVAGRLPHWLKANRLRLRRVDLPNSPGTLSHVPELRRFRGTGNEPAIRVVLALAEEALTQASYELISQD